MIYFDTAYLAKCYLPEEGHREVRALAGQAGRVQSVGLARLEVAAVLHRHLREGRLRPKELSEHLDQFDQGCADGVVTLIPVTVGLVETAAAAYRRLPADVLLRSADCLHLAAARYFRLKGVDVIAAA